MKNIKLLVFLFVGKLYGQNEIPKKSFTHTLSFDIGVSIKNQISSFDYILEKKI